VSDLERCENYIDGRFLPPSSTTYLPVWEPATGQVYAEVASSTAPDVDAACGVAAGAFPSWANTPTEKRAATLNAIAEASGAPKGSIYHRFASLNDLLGELWIRAVRRSQGEFIEALGLPDAMTAAVAAALSLYDFAERQPADAHLLASLRREDLVESVDNPRLRSELAELNRPLETAITALARRLYGRATRGSIERTLTAVVDLPIGAIRRHLIAGSPFPPTLRGQLEAAVRAALRQAGH
jgi:AcrR family transcriptional regulator